LYLLFCFFYYKESAEWNLKWQPPGKNKNGTDKNKPADPIRTGIRYWFAG
jgi:hypothetical protein